MLWVMLWGFAAAGATLGGDALAQAALPAITATPAAGGGQTYSLSIQTLLFLTSLTFLPAALLMSALLGCGSVAAITKSADQGDASAQNSLGTLHALGNGVQQDYGEAVKWFRKAADQGNADGQYSPGMAYYSGLGVERNGHYHRVL